MASQTPNNAQSSTAVVLVDPYNDFLHPEGKLYPNFEESLKVTDTNNHLKALAATARDLGLPIFYALHKPWKEGNYWGWNHLTISHKRLDGLKAFEDGSWGAKILEGLEPDVLGNRDVIASQHWNSR